MAFGSIDDAKAFAHHCHREQADKLNVAYIHHVEDVARRVAHLGGDIEIIAWLHDCVEDSDATLDEVEARFGPIVRAGVDAMTRRDNERYFEDYLPRLQSNQNAVAVKIADASHNWGKAYLLRDTDPERTRYFENKYKRALEQLGVDTQDLPEKLIFQEGSWISAASSK